MAGACGTYQEVRQILQEWDQGSKPQREQILCDFIERCNQMTGPDLEAHFYDCASLLLARITSWLRITYMFGTCLRLQLQAIEIFISASTGFLVEFLEVGGILTLLEIISLRTSLEEDKSEALRLLTLVGNKGRQYKEMICESYGVKVIAECLAHSRAQETQECSQNLLHQLATGNPRYQSQVYKALITLLTSTSPEAQRLAAYTLRLIQPSVGVVSASIVDPLLQLLKSLHSEVQHEAGLLIRDIMCYEEVQQALLVGLVSLLKPEDTSKSMGTNKNFNDIWIFIQSCREPLRQAGFHTVATLVVATIWNSEPLAVNIQQAAAARITGEIIENSSEHSELYKLIEANIVPYLLYALANTGHCDSQRQAAHTLQILIKQFPTVKELVHLLLGDQLFSKLQGSPETIHERFSLDDIDVLIGSLQQGKD